MVSKLTFSRTEVTDMQIVSLERTRLFLA